MNKLQETMKMFVENRLNDNFRRLSKDKKYSEKRQYCNDCIEKLSEGFSIELFERYREVQNQLFYQELQNAYVLGFNDCTNILFNHKF